MGLKVRLLWILNRWSCQGFQIIVKYIDVRNGVGGSRIFDEQVVDLPVLALVETNPEVRFRQSAEIVADFGVFGCHVDEQSTEWQLFDELMLVGFQYAHGPKVFGCNLGVEVTL